MPFKDPERKRQYQKDYHAKWYDENKVKRRKQVQARKLVIRKWFQDYKRTLSCEVCGISGADNPEMLDFDHRPDETKKMIVSKLVGDGYSKARILKEISKCDVLCANHHREITYERRRRHGESETSEG